MFPVCGIVRLVVVVAVQFVQLTVPPLMFMVLVFEPEMFIVEQDTLP
jgi:hypothetical protein